ncbi:MAG: LytR C-terminal domain-containing protein [Fibrobacterota bacterium]
MRNIALFLSVFALLALSVVIGTKNENDLPQDSFRKSLEPEVPDIGRVQILNGCGIDGAASEAADFLRENNFDVKDIGNADTWNYPHTIVASRTKDMTVANKVADALDTDKVILLRDENGLYDVTIFLGADFGDIIHE